MDRISSTIYEFEEFILDENQKRLYFRDTEIKLSPRNYDILVMLVKDADTIIEKQQFHDLVWRDVFVEDGNLAVSINTLRKIFKTHSDKIFIETYPRRGYKFSIPVRTILFDPIHLSNSNFERFASEPLPAVTVKRKPILPSRRVMLFIFLAGTAVLLLAVLLFALR